MCQILSYSFSKLRLLMYCPWLPLSVIKWGETVSMFCSAFKQTLETVVHCPCIDRLTGKITKVLLGSKWHNWTLSMLLH